MDNYKVKKMRKRLKAAMDKLSPEDLEMIRKYIEPDEVEREPEADYISTFEISLMLRNVDDSPENVVKINNAVKRGIIKQLDIASICAPMNVDNIDVTHTGGWREYFNEEALIPIEKKQGAYDIVGHVVGEYANRKHKYHFTYLLYGMVITISPYHCAIDMVSDEKSETIYTFDNGGEKLSDEQINLQVKLMVKKVVNYGNKVNFAKRT